MSTAALRHLQKSKTETIDLVRHKFLSLNLIPLVLLLLFYHTVQYDLSLGVVNLDALGYQQAFRRPRSRSHMGPSARSKMFVFLSLVQYSTSNVKVFCYKVFCDKVHGADVNH